MKTLGIIESFFEWVANKMNCVSLSRINRIGWVSKLVWRELSWSSHEVGQFTSFFFFFFSFSFVSFFFQTQFHTPPLLLSFLFAVPIEGTLSLSLSLSSGIIISLPIFFFTCWWPLYALPMKLGRDFSVGRETFKKSHVCLTSPFSFNNQVRLLPT